MPKLTKKYIDSIEPCAKETVVWDSELKGYGVRIYPSGRKVLLVQYRVHGRTKKLKLGAYPPLSPDKARKEALRVLATVGEGKDPKANLERRSDISVRDLCTQYLLEATSTKKDSTIAVDRGRISKHIIPLLGGRSVKSLTQADMEKFQADIARGKTALNRKNNKRHSRSIVRGGKGTAARTLGLLGGILTYARKLGYIEVNPVHGVKKFPDRVRERILSSDELQRIGRVLKSDVSIDLDKRKALRVLAFTGCRRGEIANLEWTQINFDLGYLNLEETKTGPRIIPLAPHEACVEL